MHKQCTAGDRQKLAVEIPRVASALEMVLPVYVMTMVWHVLVFHALKTLVNPGPFSVANMLVIERFHTVFKSLARGTRNVMMSIRNHYLLLETALCNRNSGTQTWSNRAPRSTAAGYAARAGSKDRTERLWSVHGKMTVMKLRDVEFQEIINLWRAHDLEYDAFWKRFLASRGRHHGNQLRVTAYEGESELIDVLASGDGFHYQVGLVRKALENKIADVHRTAARPSDSRAVMQLLTAWERAASS